LRLLIDYQQSQRGQARGPQKNRQNPSAKLTSTGRVVWELEYPLNYVKESIREAFMSESALVDDPPWSLKIPSKTLISVEVVSIPQKADQSLTTIPAPITSLPLLTVPATRGIY
jgi:hypothetical protein